MQTIPYPELSDQSFLSGAVFRPSNPFINDHNPYYNSGYSEVVLPNGFRALYESDNHEVLTQHLSSAIRAIEPNPEIVYEVVRNVLSHALGFGKRDSTYWAQVATCGDNRFEQFIPHFVHAQITAGISLHKGIFIPGKPEFRRIHICAPNGQAGYTSNTTENKHIIQQNEMIGLLSQPPKLVSIVIPALTSTYGYSRGLADTVLLRRSSSRHGLVFPGGHAQSPYECTAIREYREEVGTEVHYGVNNKVYPTLRSVSMVGMVDQFIADDDNRIQRVLAYIWRFTLTTDFLDTDLTLPIENLREIASANVQALDNKALWQIVPTSMLYYNLTLPLATITKTALDCDRKFLQPKLHV